MNVRSLWEESMLNRRVVLAVGLGCFSFACTAGATPASPASTGSQSSRLAYSEQEVKPLPGIRWLPDEAYFLAWEFDDDSNCYRSPRMDSAPPACSDETLLAEHPE